MTIGVFEKIGISVLLLFEFVSSCGFRVSKFSASALALRGILRTGILTAR
jgi:hypothetical protein